KKLSQKSFALSALVAASVMAAGAFASDKTEPRNEVYKDKFKNQYASWHDTAKSAEIVDVLAEDPNLVILWAGYG
ncbi:ammonia-forming cytochrome c nitrite reductase subunit c552, partial [Vibrio parahaemolyticus]